MSISNVRYEFTEIINNFFDKVYKDIQRIKKISDIQEQYREVIENMSSSLFKWNSKILDFYLQFKEKGKLGNWQEINQGFANITQKRYDGLDSPYKILLNFKQQLERELEKIDWLKSSDNPKSKEERINILSDQIQTVDSWFCSNFFCPTFFEEKTGSYLYNSEKQDGRKFCSENCYLEEYGEVCNICKNKFLNFHRYNNLVYCPTCWKDYWKKEENRLEQELTQGKKNSESIHEKLKSLDEQIKRNDEIINSVNNNPNYNTLHREREREREQFLQYFTKNNIKSIKLENNKLIIKYNHKEEEEEEPKTEELQKIKDYIQKQPTNILTKEELEKNSKEDRSSNSVGNKNKGDKTSLYIGCGIAGAFILLLIIVLARNHQKKIRK